MNLIAFHVCLEFARRIEESTVLLAPFPCHKLVAQDTHRFARDTCGLIDRTYISIRASAAIELPLLSCRNMTAHMYELNKCS